MSGRNALTPAIAGIREKKDEIVFAATEMSISFCRSLRSLRLCGENRLIKKEMKFKRHMCHMRHGKLKLPRNFRLNRHDAYALNDRSVRHVCVICGTGRKNSNVFDLTGQANAYDRFFGGTSVDFSGVYLYNGSRLYDNYCLINEQMQLKEGRHVTSDSAKNRDVYPV